MKINSAFVVMVSISIMLVTDIGEGYILAHHLGYAGNNFIMGLINILFTLGASGAGFAMAVILMKGGLIK